MKTNLPTPTEETLQTTAITVFKIDIDPNLPESRREVILGGYRPIYKQIQELELEYSALTQADVTVFTPKLAKQAGILRKKLVALRGKDGLRGIHDSLKEDVKLEGQTIDILERTPRELLLSWEEALREIEEFPEREEARRVAELHVTRTEAITMYVLDPNAPELAVLGEMTDEAWERCFEKFRAAWNAEQDRIAKEKLRKERLDIAKTYELYIEEFSQIAWESLTEKMFNSIVSTAKDAHERREKEAERVRQEYEAEKERAEAARMEANLKFKGQAEFFLLGLGYEKDPHGFSHTIYHSFIGEAHYNSFNIVEELEMFKADKTAYHNSQLERIKAEQAAKEAADRAQRYRVRVAAVKGAEQREDGLYYKGKKIAEVKSLENGTEEAFQKFLTGHLATYAADVKLEEERQENERKAIAERAAAQAKIQADIDAQKAAEEKARKEAADREAEMIRKKAEAQAAANAAKGAPDSEKLRELAKAFAAIEIPRMSTEKGMDVIGKFQQMQEKWIAGIVRVAEELEPKQEEVTASNFTHLIKTTQ